MMIQLNDTHDPARKSWVESANNGTTDFPIQNLPYCFFSVGGTDARPGVAIGDSILDLISAVSLGLLGNRWAAMLKACAMQSLNPLLALDAASRSALRTDISNLLKAEYTTAAASQAELLTQISAVTFRLPAAIGGFTDFFTSLYHTERGGRVTRPDAPIPPNFRYMPIAYNSRASSVRISGEAVRRPNGQWRKPNGEVYFGATEALDFELELGAFVSHGNEVGDPIPVATADNHVFGYCLLNDWSARDIQRWESFPLGPFLSKTLSTSISPFVVTSEALLPFRSQAMQRPEGDPVPLPYLYAKSDQAFGGIDLTLDALIETGAMREAGEPAFRVTRTSFKEMYWTVAQMLAHHTSNGCNLQTGDLIGSGTTSGSTDESRACMSEITGGKTPIDFPNGEQRLWLQDGDAVVFRACASREGFVSIGFGECRGQILPAHPVPADSRK